VSKDWKSELTGLERLAALLRDDGLDIDSMNEQDLARYLKENKVDIAKLQQRFDDLLKKARARLRLESARQRRLQVETKVEALMSAAPATIESIRKKVHSMIERLRQNDPEQAKLYARQFEKATPEDLALLERDLMFLEMESGENDKADQQNQS